MSDLLKDVIADAKAVKAVAYANAKAALEEAFAPSIQRMVSARLAEEEGEEEEEQDFEPVPEEGGDEEMDLDMEEPTEEEPVEEEEEEDLELEALIRELEGEDTEMESEPAEDDDMAMEGEEEEEDAMMEALLRELEEEGYLEDGEDATPSSMGTSLRKEAEGEDEDEMMEALLRELEDDEMMGEEEEEENMAPVAEARKLRHKLKTTQKKLNEALKANAVLKSTLNELNLLNAKLMYATKVNRMGNLSESQQMKILQAFDRASTTREVQLVYTTLAETLKKQSAKRVSLREGASKSIRAVVPNKNEFSFAPRWAQLAGISKNSKG